MKALVDISGELVKGLAEICAREGVSRAEGIRRAIALFVQRQEFHPADSNAFGLWRDRKVEGTAYEDSLRAEWSLEAF